MVPKEYELYYAFYPSLYLCTYNRACACDLAGAINDDCDLVSGQCTCRTNTHTRDCSQCADGTFNLQPSNPDGCQPCFCSGQSSTCTDAQGFGASSIVTEFNSSEPVTPIFTANCVILILICNVHCICVQSDLYTYYDCTMNCAMVYN